MKLDIPDEELVVLVASSCISCFEVGVRNGKRLLKPSGLLRNDLLSDPEENLDEQCEGEITMQNMLASFVRSDDGHRLALTSSFLQGYAALVTDHRLFVFPPELEREGITFHDELLVTPSQVGIVRTALCDALEERGVNLETPSLITFAYVAGTRFYRSVVDSMEVRQIFAASEEDDHEDR